MKKPAAAICFLIILMIFALSAEKCFAGADWDQWNADRMIKGNFSVKGITTSITNSLFDNTCSKYGTRGLEIVSYADDASNLNLRIWLLGKSQALSQSYHDESKNPKTFIILPGFTWKGVNANDPGVSVIGSKGFACNGAGAPPGAALPYIVNNTSSIETVEDPPTVFTNYEVFDIMRGTYVGYLQQGNFSFSDKTIDGSNLDTLIDGVTGTAPSGKISTTYLGAMDTALRTIDESTYHNRTNSVDAFSDLSTWLNGNVVTNDYAFAQFTYPWPINPLDAADTAYEKHYFKDIYNAGLLDTITTCNVATYNGSSLTINNIGEGHYRNVLAGGWKVAPVIGYPNNDDASLLSTNIAAYTGVWLPESNITDFQTSSAPLPSKDDMYFNPVRNVSKYLKTSRKTYVSTLYNTLDSEQAASLVLEAIDHNSNTIQGKMGDEIAWKANTNPIKFRLSIKYKHNTPRSKMIVEEKASLVMIYDYNEANSKAHSAEIPFINPRTKHRNYLFDSAVNNEIKDRTNTRAFSHVFNKLNKVQCIYGKVVFRLPETAIMNQIANPDLADGIKDYYKLKKRIKMEDLKKSYNTGSSGGGTTYVAITAPIFIR